MIVLFIFTGLPCINVFNYFDYEYDYDDEWDYDYDYCACSLQHISLLFKHNQYTG